MADDIPPAQIHSFNVAYWQLYNDMRWVVMNMLCFVNFLLMVCWNLHMLDVEI